MKNAFTLPLLAACMLLLNSCSVVGGIFKAGMGFGIFLVVAVVIGIIVLVTRSGKK